MVRAACIALLLIALVRPASVFAAPPANALKTQALRDAIAAQKGGVSALRKGAVVNGEFTSPSGDFYVAIGIIAPKENGVATDAYDTLFGEVADASGTVVISFEQPTHPISFKHGVFSDRALSGLPTGRYTAVVGLAKAGTPLVIGGKSFDVQAVGKESVGTSGLLTCDFIELPEALPEKTGFAFGKMQVIPNQVFDRSDAVMIFIEMHNPGIDSATHEPKLQVSFDLTGGKFTRALSRPLADMPTAPLSGKPGPGQYALIDEIPLDRIKDIAPGDYTLRMKILDTVTRKSYSIEQSFRVSDKPSN